MRQFSANFAVFLAYIFGAFFGAFLQENCQEIVWQFCIFFKLFREDFLCKCVQGWERRDFGQIPVKMRPSRSGLHWKYSFLQRDVNEKRDCESYPRKTVKPSFEPQPTCLIPKMRFLRRSGRKYEKSCSYGHGVSWGLAKVVCLVCANCGKSQKSAKKCEKSRKMRKVAEKACKKAATYGMIGKLWGAGYGRMYCEIKR